MTALVYILTFLTSGATILGLIKFSKKEKKKKEKKNKSLLFKKETKRQNKIRGYVVRRPEQQCVLYN